MNLVSLKEWDKDKIESVVDQAIHIKNHQENYRHHLAYETLAMIFQKTSTRTRISFEVAMTQLGGHGIFMDWKNSNFILAEIKDEIRYLTRNVDIIMARLLHNKDLQVIAENSSVPVINGCCEKYHPCQILADLTTIKEYSGKIEGAHLVYTGIHNNVCNSFITAASKTGLVLTLVTPEINEPCYDGEIMKLIDECDNINIASTLKEVAKDADYVYTDSWVDMEFFLDPAFEEEKKRRVESMMPYQINKENLDGTKAFIMHDMPIHEGYEITRECIESEQSIIFPQSENRLHAQKAVLLNLLGKI